MNVKSAQGHQFWSLDDEICSCKLLPGIFNTRVTRQDPPKHIANRYGTAFVTNNIPSHNIKVIIRSDEDINVLLIPFNDTCVSECEALQMCVIVHINFGRHR